MVLYKATKEGNVPLTKEEEAEIRASWSDENVRPQKKTLEQRVIDLELAVSILSKGK